MNDYFIALPEAIPGKEYIIHSVKKRENAGAFHGYGIFPGSTIKLLFSSPSGNPAAYEVMGSVLALRREDSGHIFVVPSTLPN